MKLIPALFAGAAAVAAVAAQDVSSTQETVTDEQATTTKAPRTPKECVAPEIRMGKWGCGTPEEIRQRKKDSCAKKFGADASIADQREWVDSLGPYGECVRTLDSMKARCAFDKEGNGTGKQLISMTKKRDLDYVKSDDSESDKSVRKNTLGHYKCVDKCAAGEKRFGKGKKCAVCPEFVPENPFGLKMEDFKLAGSNGVRVCARACTGLSKRDRKTGKCVLDVNATERSISVDVPAETDGLPSAMQELLASAFTRLQADSNRARRAGKPVRNPNPTMVRLAFHQSMGKADQCLDTTHEFNKGLATLREEVNASYTLMAAAWDAFKNVAPPPTDFCKKKATGECQVGVMKNADGSKMMTSGAENPKGKPMKVLAKSMPYWTRSNPRKFKYGVWHKHIYAEFEKLFNAHTGVAAAMEVAHFTPMKLKKLFGSFLATQVFPATLAGPEFPEEQGYKAAMPSEKLMSLSDYFAFQYIEAMDKSLPIKYNPSCNEVKDVLHKPKLDEDGNFSEITCYDPASNNDRQVEYLTKKYGRVDSDCATATPTDNMPDAMQDFDFNVEKMQGMFDGLTAHDMALLLGAHTLGAMHEENSGFRTGTWVNCPGNLNVKFFQIIKSNNWSPFTTTTLNDAGEEVTRTSFRLLRNEEQCLELETVDGRGCTEIQQNVNVNGTEQVETFKILSRQIGRLSVDRERGALPLDMSLLYNFNGDDNDFQNNGLPLFDTTNKGVELPYPQTNFKKADEATRSAGFATVDQYTSGANMEEKRQGAANFLLDFMPTFQKMIENGYASDFSGDANKSGLQAKEPSNELFEACMKLYADRHFSSKSELKGDEMKSREKERMQHCYHFDEDKLDDGDGFEQDDEGDASEE